MLYIMLPSVNRRTALTISNDTASLFSRNLSSHPARLRHTPYFLLIEFFPSLISSYFHLPFSITSSTFPYTSHLLPPYNCQVQPLGYRGVWILRRLFFFWLISTTFAHGPIDNLLDLALPILGLICRPSRSNFLPFVPLSPSDVFSIYNFTLQKTYPAMEQ